MYSVEGFVDKNRDVQQEVFLELLNNSEKTLVQELTNVSTVSYYIWHIRGPNDQMLFFPFRKHSTYRTKLLAEWPPSRVEPTSRSRPKVTRSASNCSRWSTCSSPLIHGKAPESYHADERSPISGISQVHPLHQAQCRKAGRHLQRADGTRPVALSGHVGYHPNPSRRLSGPRRL
jgi:hypothetical protein